MQNHDRRKKDPSPIIFLLLISFGYAVYAIDRTVLSAVLVPISSSLSLSNVEVGLLGSAQYIGVLCVVFLAGHFSDRYGQRSVLVWGVVVFTLFTWMIGFSSNFMQAFLFRLASGFGEGVFWPVAMASIATHFKQGKGLALGIFYVGFDVGSVAGLSIGGVVYYLASNWQPVFFVAPSIGLLVIAGIISQRDRFVADKETEKTIRLGRDALELLKRKQVLLLMIFGFLATWASVWQVVFLPYYYNKVLHFSVLNAAFLSSIVFVFGAMGKVALGGMSDTLKRNRMLALISFAIMLSYFLFFATSNPVLAFAGAISMGFFSASIFPILQALMADSCSGKVGTAMGLTTSAQSLATVISPVMTASLFVLGVGKALALDAMIPAAMAAILALALKETRRPMK